jgi:hypothetical protein
MHPETIIDWKVQQKEIHGCDTDPKVACIARLNTFMEMGGNCPTNLHTRDSLYGDLIQIGYDIILANMPFGIDGLKHADCCERVKALKLRGTKSEPLFLQLMMASLNEMGRCAVILPETTLTNNSVLHVQTRKHLFNNFEVLQVLKMKGKFFMNTSIKPVILFFKKSGKPTSSIEFSEISKNSSGEIVKEIITNMSRDMFNSSLSFDLKLYTGPEVSIESSTKLFELKEINSIVTCKNGKNIPVRDRLETGAFPYYASNGVKGYVDKYIFEGPCTLLGDQGSAWDKSAHYVSKDTKFYAGNHTIVMRPKSSDIDIKYVYYYLKMNNLSYYNKSSSIIPELDKDRFNKMKIPVPPIDIQLQIINSLDKLVEAFGDSLEFTSETMNLVLSDPSGKIFEPLYDVKKLMDKSTETITSIKGKLQFKITL